jgi:hypothetical protein
MPPSSPASTGPLASAARPGAVCVVREAAAAVVWLALLPFHVRTPAVCAFAEEGGIVPRPRRPALTCEVNYMLA